MIDVFLKPQKYNLYKEVNSFPAGNLLEIGVGNGKYLHLYQNHKITGIDISSRMLKIAQKQEVYDIRLVQMNGEHLLFSDHHFDYIVVSHTITVVDNPEKLFQEMYRVLKPTGHIFILNHFTPKNWLRYLDLGFHRISRILHFKSKFRIEDIASIKKFNLIKEIEYKPLSYFKLLIYSKT
ncbi:class I SAM-dependent methyltransferase [Aquimarina addita]|uniref:Class I SAM-dependent methyltransferase n=2 Tax=Aquimarina addita TaxID=870485 RepID=A0ABP7XF82_9FLAO